MPHKKEKLEMASILGRGKLVLAFVGISVLSACSGSDDGIFAKPKPPLPCPKVAVLPNADSITIFKEGPGRDLVDVLFEGVIAPVGGDCIYENDDSEVYVELILRIGGVKGPAARTQKQDFPFFIAIADASKKVLTKKVFISPIVVPEGRRRAAVQEEIAQRIPLPSGLDGRDYTIVMGFQLTHEQLKYNQKAQ